jgi:hypothetical protein
LEDFIKGAIFNYRLPTIGSKNILRKYSKLTILALFSLSLLFSLGCFKFNKFKNKFKKKRQSLFSILLIFLSSSKFEECHSSSLVSVYFE